MSVDKLKVYKELLNHYKVIEVSDYGLRDSVEVTVKLGTYEIILPYENLEQFRKAYKELESKYDIEAMYKYTRSNEVISYIKNALEKKYDEYLKNFEETNEQYQNVNNKVSELFRRSETEDEFFAGLVDKYNLTYNKEKNNYSYKNYVVIRRNTFDLPDYMRTLTYTIKNVYKKGLDEQDWTSDFINLARGYGLEIEGTFIGYRSCFNHLKTLSKQYENEIHKISKGDGF